MVVAIVDGWPHGFDPSPCRRSARFQIPMLAGARWSPLAGFSPSATHAAFLFLFFIPAQIVAVNGPVPRYPPYPSFPHAVVSNQFSLLPAYRTSTSFGWVPRMSIYTHHHPCDRKPSLLPPSFKSHFNLDRSDVDLSHCSCGNQWMRKKPGKGVTC